MSENVRIDEAAEAIKAGDVLVDQGRLEDALAVYKTGLDLNRALAADYPENATHWREQSVCHDRIGDTLMTLDRADEALAAYETSIKLSTLLVRVAPSDPKLGEDLAIGYNNAGDALAKLGRPDEALARFELGVAMRARLVESHPDNAVLRRQLMVNLIKLAQTSKDAATCYRRAREQALWLAAAGKLGPNEGGIPDLLGRKVLEMETAALGDGRSKS